GAPRASRTRKSRAARRRRFPSVSRCRSAKCDALNNSLLIVIFFSRSALRWWCGRPLDSPCLPNETALVRLVIINREATEFDEIADVVIRQDIGTVLSPFIVHCFGRRGRDLHSHPPLLACKCILAFPVRRRIVT